MSNDIDKTKDCHEYCHYGSVCKKYQFCPGAIGKDPDDCPAYFKIDDLMMEAHDMAREDKYLAEREEREEEWQ